MRVLKDLRPGVSLEELYFLGSYTLRSGDTKGFESFCCYFVVALLPLSCFEMMPG